MVQRIFSIFAPEPNKVKTMKKMMTICLLAIASVLGVSAQSEIIDSAIVLFERYRHGNYGYIKTTI